MWVVLIAGSVPPVWPAAQLSFLSMKRFGQSRLSSHPSARSSSQGHSAQKITRANTRREASFEYLTPTPTFNADLELLEMGVTRA